LPSISIEFSSQKIFMCNNINMIAVATGKFKRSFVVKLAKFKRRFPVMLGRATISHSTFTRNRGMLGGAVLAWGSTLTVQSSDLDANRAVSGGALTYLSPAGSNPLNSRLHLKLAHVKMRDNEAAKDGGALLVLGDVSGDAVKMSRNTAGESGGALAVVGATVSPKEAVPAEIGDELPVPGSQPTQVELMRAFILDNKAAQHVVDGGSGVLRFGNALFARNIATTSGGATIDVRDLELANSTVIGNQAEGVHIEAGGARIANVILASNATNCGGMLASLKVEGGNLQFPDTGCGASMLTADPSLDARFAPTLFSVARDAGTVSVCASHDLVSGRDLYAEARGSGSCSLGAVEADVIRDAIATVDPTHIPWLLLWFLVLLLVFFTAGFILATRRCKKKT
jgi:hypothetical protein